MATTAKNGRVTPKKERPDDGPVHIGGESYVEVREVLFELDGVEYTIPTKIHPKETLRYFRNVKKEGAEFAQADFLERVIGADAMDALIESDEVQPEDIDRVFEAAFTKLQGASKGPG